jgi:hypothetical protein
LEVSGSAVVQFLMEKLTHCNKRGSGIKSHKFSRA